MAAALLSLVSSTAFARSSAASELMRARSFCMFCTAYTGRIISGDDAFISVVRSRTAAEQFQAVFDTGTMEAKMYALVGLREIDRPRFDAAFRSISKRRFSLALVVTEDPPSILRERSDVVLKNIRDGKYSGFVEWAKTGRLSR